MMTVIGYIWRRSSARSAKPSVDGVESCWMEGARDQALAIGMALVAVGAGVVLLFAGLMALDGCAGEGAPEGAAARTAALEGNIRTGVCPEAVCDGRGGRRWRVIGKK